jgi:hypothetical protein
MKTLNPKDYIGRPFKSNNYGSFKIVDFKNCNDVTVEFCDTGYIRCATLNSIRRGAVSDKTYQKLREDNSKLYRVWSSMKSRCDNKKSVVYKDYGGRGIIYNAQWSSFVNFLEWAKQADYKVGLDLDRIDNNKGYSPDNCRFTTRRVNSRNRRNNSVLGSCIYKQSKNYLVRVYKNNKLYNLGTHESVELAELVRNEFLSAKALGGY